MTMTDKNTNTVAGASEPTRRNEYEQDQPETGKNKGCSRILIHVGLILIAAVLLTWAGLAFLKVYTRWGEAVAVPSVSGLSQTEAEAMLRKNDLRMEVIDSVYVDSARPGVVMDTNPAVGSKVKSGRVIFVTVNANGARQATLPLVIQLSKRQAIATLMGAGFTKVVERYVPGEFDELVVGVKDGKMGSSLVAGKRMPINTPIVLEVSSATLLDSLMMVEQALERDSLASLGTNHTDDTPQNQNNEPTQPAQKEDPDGWF